MSSTSVLRVALDALTGRLTHVAEPEPRGVGGPGGEPVATLEDQREALAQVLCLSEQGFWGSGRDTGSPQGTAWGTSTERYLRDRYLNQADAIIAAGFRKDPTLAREDPTLAREEPTPTRDEPELAPDAPSLTREAVEAAHRDEGSSADPDEWIVVAWALGIEVSTGG